MTSTRKTVRRALLALLLVSLLVQLLPATAFAYGEDDQTLIITHINTSPTTEGSAIIISGSNAKKVGEKGGFQWWCLYIFDWDIKQNCFVLKEKHTKTGTNEDKSDVEIPQHGFAYGICVGNDYTSSGGINYITDRVKNSYAYAAKLDIGTKAYLYGTHLYGGTIKTNGKNWYDPAFVSESYIKIGAPDDGKVAYNPVDSWGEAAQQRILTTEKANFNHYANGDCLLFTPAHGLTAGPDSGVTVGPDYSWWSSVVFAWDASKKCYVCVATDFNTGNGNAKRAVLPRNGFVIMDCSSASNGAVKSCSVGTKAWLYENPEKPGCHIVCLNLPEDGMNLVLLGDVDDVNDEQLATPVVTAPAAGESVSPKGITVRWDAVPGATNYTFALSCSTPNPFNDFIVQPTVQTGTSYTVPAGTLKVGNVYTAVVYANGADGKATSIPAYARFFCVSEESMTSSLRDKTIVAFGDSLTARSGWVNLLGAQIGTEVVNAGVGGDSTGNGKSRFEKDVLAKNPDITLICFGMNDQAQQTAQNRPLTPLDTYTENLTYFVTELQKIDSDVVFICPHDAYAADGYYQPNEYGLDYAYGNMKLFCEAMRQVAVAYHCDIIDIYAETLDEDMSKFLNPGDGIHQSTYGHEKWAEYVGNYLSAKYDGRNKATVTVECKDADGKSCGSYTLTGAVGATLYVPAKPVASKSLVGEEKLLTLTGDTTVTYRYTDEPTAALGDLTGDSRIDSSDYLLLKRYMLGTFALSETQKPLADINRDGKVDSTDYLLLKRHILGTYKIG